MTNRKDDILAGTTPDQKRLAVSTTHPTHPLAGPGTNTQTGARARKRLFSLGSIIREDYSVEAQTLSNALCWLLSKRNTDGTWGGPDSLDVFISTSHVVMTLFAAGFIPTSDFIRPSLDYLVDIDEDKHISFFLRSGPLLNIPRFSHIVQHDINYMWEYKRRIAVHKDYPVPFFLLKLLRFIDDPSHVSVSVKDVVDWILEDFKKDTCWYDRASITSMAVALLYDLDFDRKADVVNRSISYLTKRCEHAPAGAISDSGNLVEDLFIIYNLCERDFFDVGYAPRIWAHLKTSVPKILEKAQSTPHWSSPPPFGGAIGLDIYPTAVAIRALLAFYSKVDEFFINQLSLALFEKMTERRIIMPTDTLFGIPFWGPPVGMRSEPYCFILMPFEPKLTQIYERYMKNRLNKKLE